MVRKLFHPILIVIILAEIALCAYIGLKISTVLRRGGQQSGSPSIIHTSVNTSNPQSTLKYYYEPVASSTEEDTAPWLTQPVSFTYNKDTLNDRFDYTVDKPAATLRIIALGDSFTFGDHVNTADSWPEKLEDMLNQQKPCPNYQKYEVLNLGERGFDIQNAVERFRLRGAKYHPDLVIWLLIPHNFVEIRELMQGKLDETYNHLKAVHELDSLRPWLVPYKTAEAELFKKYSMQQLAEMQNGFFRNFNSIYNGKLLLATFPFTYDQYKAHMRTWMQNRPGTYYVDSLPDMEGNADFRVADSHPSVLGHQKIAQDLYNYLTGRSDVLCRN
jgi:hypothetical protein